MDLGQIHRGVDMGPSAIRYGGIAESIDALGYTVIDMGNINVAQRYTQNIAEPEDLYGAIHQSLELSYQTIINGPKSDFTIFLGGDHTIAIASIAAMAKDQNLGVLWIDAHCDANTPETSPSGHIHGMPLSAVLGYGHPELVNIGGSGPKISSKDVVLIGVRSVDPGERDFLKEQNVLIFTMRDLDEQGMGTIMHKALDHLSHCSKIHVSFDLDSLDPKDAPGVGTPCPGGISYREAQLGMEIVADCRKCISLDLVEINPILDDRNKTAQVGCELAASLLGKRIL